MTIAITEGIMLGMLMSMLIGPVFFLLIETSISRGIRAALSLDLGVFLSDVLFVLLAYFFAAGINAWLKEEEVYFSLAGGIIFMTFGLSRIFQKKQMRRPVTVSSGRTFGWLFFKGLLLNSVNPSVVVFWLGAVVMTFSKYEENSNLVLLYFIAALFTILIVDVIKIVTAKKFLSFMKPKLMKRINQVTGIILFIFGLVFLWNGFFGT